MSQIRLRNLRKNDTDLIVKWRNKESIKKWLYNQKNLSREEHLKYFEENIISKKCFQFIINEIDKNGLELAIGTSFIKNIDLINKKGEFGIFIGEEGKQGKGFGSIASKKTLEFAFEELRLHRVYLSVLKDNHKAIHAYEKAGFQVEGILKEDFLKNNIYFDVVLMGIVNSRF